MISGFSQIRKYTLLRDQICPFLQKFFCELVYFCDSTVAGENGI